MYFFNPLRGTDIKRVDYKLLIISIPLVSRVVTETLER